MLRALHPVQQRMADKRCYRRSPVGRQGLHPVRWRLLNYYTVPALSEEGGIGCNERQYNKSIDRSFDRPDILPGVS